MTELILQQYGFTGNSVTVTAFGTGLINNTWLVKYAGKKYILQRINQSVFKNPGYIDDNISALAMHLQKNSPGYTFTVPVSTTNGKTLIETADGAFRMFEFIEGSHTYDVLKQPQQAFEAARQFGRFTRLLHGFDITRLKITLPEFHNLSLRCNQFNEAVEHGNTERIAYAESLIDDLRKYAPLVHIYEGIQLNPDFKKRVTHHDTKI
ncbi:MAG TPA: phosphotransferase, partial [Chitinophagaceae bacterium]|nr:phosphotransferase [Chitinophagaceae bacterium]